MDKNNEDYLRQRANRPRVEDYSRLERIHNLLQNWERDRDTSDKEKGEAQDRIVLRAIHRILVEF